MRFRDEWAAATIEAVEDITPTIRMFTLRPVDHYLNWSAGAHLRVGINIEGRQEVRTYSLIHTGLDDGAYRIAVKLIEHGLGGSRYMWSLRVGETLDISQPHNQFELSRHGSSYTLVAGGVGITPLVSMAYALRASNKPVRLIYGVRTRSEAAFAGLLADWLGKRFELRVADEDGPLDINQIVSAVEPASELYLCGPIGMLEAASAAWAARGFSMGLLRFETFAASGHYPNREFTVEIPRLNKSITVPEHQSMLDALEQAGVEVISDCRRGECGLCAVDVISNDEPLDHRDVFFSSRQKQSNLKMCACVSRCAGGKVIIDTAYRSTEAD